MESELEPVVFTEAVNGLRKALGKRFTPELAAELARVGIDYDRPQVAYAIGTWLAAATRVAAHLGPEVPEADRYRHLGQSFIRSFIATPLGIATVGAAKLMGVKRTLLRMGRNFKTACNYLECEGAETGPNEVRLRVFVAAPYLPKVKDPGNVIVGYRRGVLEGTLEAVGAKGTVEIIDAVPERYDYTYRITWS